MVQTTIILRQSLNWGSISYHEFQEQSREFCRIINRPPEQVNMSVDLWNKTFKHSFFEVRQELKDIALANFASVENVKVLDGTLQLSQDDIEEGFYVFTDDDDWIHPKIALHLSDIDNGYQEDAVVWGSVAFGTPKDKIIYKRKPDGFFYTNNYAITGKFLAHEPGNYQNVFQHFGANVTMKTKSVKIVDDYWSVTNKNPSSTVYLEQILKNDFSSRSLIVAVEQYIKRFDQLDHESDPSLQWVRPLMERVLAVFSKLV